MTEGEIVDELRAAYAARADLNRRIDELQELLKTLLPDYRKIMEQIKG